MAVDGEYKSQVGLDQIFIAAILEDSIAAYTAGTPEWFAPAMEATVEPTVNSTTQYADDKPFDTMSSEGETRLTFNITNIPLAMRALVTGKTYDAATGRIFDGEGSSPEFALGFRSLKTNGKYRYYWMLKGKFEAPSGSFSTKKDTPEPQAQEITYVALSTIHRWTVGGKLQSLRKVEGDEDIAAFVPTGWFTQVQVPGTTVPAALTLSASVPADNATGVAVSASQTLTFSNPLPSGAPAGVSLLAANGAVIEPSAYSLDATGKIITIDPASDLAAATGYVITYAVTDVYGQSLRGAINFTTA